MSFYAKLARNTCTLKHKIGVKMSHTEKTKEIDYAEKARQMIALNLTFISKMGTVEEILEKLKGKIGVVVLNPIILLNVSLWTVRHICEEYNVKVFMNYNLNGSPEEMEVAGEKLMSSDISMISVNIASGGPSLRALMDKFYIEATDIEKDDEKKEVNIFKTKIRLKNSPLVFGNTIPTYMDQAIATSFFSGAVKNKYIFNRQLFECNLDGVICRPEDLPSYNNERYDLIKKIVVNIVPEAKKNNAKTMTPTYAVKNGADLIVFDYPIVNPYYKKNPENKIILFPDTLTEIMEEISKEVDLAIRVKERIRMAKEEAKKRMATMTESDLLPVVVANTEKKETQQMTTVATATTKTPINKSSNLVKFPEKGKRNRIKRFFGKGKDKPSLAN